MSPRTPVSAQCLLLALCGVLAFADSTARAAGIYHLAGEPDYRAVRLKWETDEPSDRWFVVRYCELQSWGPHRCRSKPVREEDLQRLDTSDESNETDDITTRRRKLLPIDSPRQFTVDVSGLRMATTYSFEVRRDRGSGLRNDRSSDSDTIIVPTKGFSARATQCLPQASEVEVSTGPFFAGRIAVEAADGERCAIDGEPNDPKDTYILRIDHARCGSHVNETTVATFVLVQENLPILTHSTRRFLVLCSYQPETLTVRAGLSLPTGMGRIGPVTHQESPPGNYRRHRMLAESHPGNAVQYEHYARRPLVRSTKSAALSAEDEGNSLLLAVMTVVVVAGLCVLAGTIYFRKYKKRWMDAADGVSITSSDSSSSCRAGCNIEMPQ